MEEILINQRFSYAKITPYKNYSKIPDNTVSIDRGLYRQMTYNDKFGGTTTQFYGGDEGIGLAPMLDDIKKKNTRYFYWEDDFQDVPIIRYASKHKEDGVTGVFYTTKDRHIKKYYNEPFSDILVVILERTIIKRGDKITIKAYKYTKHRGFNCKYFQKNTYSSSITFDMVKGNFLIRAGGCRGKTKAPPQFKKNSFYNLMNFIKSTDGPFRFLNNHMSKNNKLFNELHKEFNNKHFNQVVCNVFNNTITYPTEGFLFKDFFYDEVMKWFVTTKKIKTPNHYRDFLYRYYPTEKYLKKNDRKLVAAILDVLQIKSKVTIKLLHEVPNIDLKSFIRLCYIFGEQYQKYIGLINPDLFGLTNSIYSISDSSFTSLGMIKHYSNEYKNHGWDINDVEKENLLKVIMSVNYPVNESFIGIVADHFKMLKKIREYFPDIRMKANTRTKFDAEHTELSKLISQIKKGWVIQYFYPEQTIKEIQQPIKVFKSVDVNPNMIGTDMDENVTIYPFVLTREEEYVEEGKFMHHCVASYAETDTSMIVSLRTEDKQDRVTCEFKLSNGNLVQARHFSNKVPPKYFEHAIEHLSDLIRLYARIGTLNWLKKEKVPIKINGIEIPSEKREPRRLIDILDTNGEGLPF